MSFDTTTTRKGSGGTERTGEPPTGTKPPRGDDELDAVEIASAVWAMFVQGGPMLGISAEMKKKYPGLKMSREQPYRIIREAAARDWITFTPPQHARYAKALEDKYDWLQSVRVVRTTTPRDVAQAGAEALLRLLKSYRTTKGQRVVHIGFAGGHAMRALAHAFAKLLDVPPDNLPDVVVIHSLAGGFDDRDPTTDPNTFCSYFADGPLREIEVKFVRLAAPSLVNAESIGTIREQPGIKEAFAAARDLDIIVGSGSCWNHEHNALREFMEQSTESMHTLDEEKCVGDFILGPLSYRGPIKINAGVRALTLVELSDLPGLIEQGKHVLVTLASCGLCGTPKGELLACLLKQKPPLMTDLVADSRTVAAMLRLNAAAAGH